MMSPKPTRLPAPPTAIRSMSVPSAAIAIPILSILPNIPLWDTSSQRTPMQKIPSKGSIPAISVMQPRKP